MSIFRAAILVAALAASGSASAASIDEIAAKASGASVAQSLTDALISRHPLMLEGDAAAAAATQRYFDYDALLSLGALALSISGVAAYLRRAPRREGRDNSVRWMQNDLAQRFAQSRDAA